MLEDLERLTGEWKARQDQYPETAALLGQALQMAQEETAPRQDEEFVRQKLVIVERVIEPLGLDEEEALAQLPSNFPSRRESYDSLCVSVPLLVPQFRDVSWLSAVDAAGFYVSDYLRGKIIAGDVHPWKDPRGIYVPEGPHGLWLQDGTQGVYSKPVDVRNQLQGEEYEDLFAGGLWVSFTVALLREDLVEGRGWFAIGDSVVTDEVEDIPFLSKQDSKLGFLTHRVDISGPRSRALVFGR